MYSRIYNMNISFPTCYFRLGIGSPALSAYFCQDCPEAVPLSSAIKRRDITMLHNASLAPCGRQILPILQSGSYGPPWRDISSLDEKLRSFFLVSPQMHSIWPIYKPFGNDTVEPDLLNRLTVDLWTSQRAMSLFLAVSNLVHTWITSKVQLICNLDKHSMLVTEWQLEQYKECLSPIDGLVAYSMLVADWSFWVHTSVAYRWLVTLNTYFLFPLLRGEWSLWVHCSPSFMIISYRLLSV